MSVLSKLSVLSLLVSSVNSCQLCQYLRVLSIRSIQSMLSQTNCAVRSVNIRNFCQFLRNRDQRINAPYYVLRCYSSQVYSDGYWVVIKFIYLYKISKPSSTATDHMQPELECVIQIGWLLCIVTEILAFNMELDNAECCGTSERLSWSYKKGISGHIKWSMEAKECRSLWVEKYEQ